MNPAAQLAIIKQLSRHESCGPAVDYQVDEQGFILRLSWLLSSSLAGANPITHHALTTWLSCRDQVTERR